MDFSTKVHVRFNLCLFRPARTKSSRVSDPIEDKSSIHRIDNLEFYNRHKPTAPNQNFNELPRPLKDRPDSAKKANEPRFYPHAPAERLPTNHQNAPPNQRGKNHRRAKTHDSQKFSTLRNGGSAGATLRWNDPSLDAKKPPVVRHSVYTDQPSAFSQYLTPRTSGAKIAEKSDSISGRARANPMWQPHRPNNSSSSSVESNQTASSNGLGVTERNRHEKSTKPVPKNL